MRVTANIDCKCGFKTAARFIKPRLLGVETGKVICSGCESEIQYFVTRSKDHGKVDLRIQYRTMSAELVGMLLEEKQEELRGLQHEQSKESIQREHEGSSGAGIDTSGAFEQTTGGSILTQASPST